ncbi:CDP-alcohol phosphatidyltransferase family protein [Spirochaetota bacterium]
MIPKNAKIISKDNYPFDKRICGLYPLERLINVLYKIGVRTIYFELSDEEKLFVTGKVLKKLKRLKDLKIIYEKGKEGKLKCFKLYTNLFSQHQLFDDLNSYFRKKDNFLIPKTDDKQFYIKDNKDIKIARHILKRRILDSTPGFFAREVNKRVSLPISSILSSTGIHPNAVTLFNMLLGVLCAFLVYLNTYTTIALGGILFQIISVVDGVDGEVAVLTFKTSSFGALLDTISDLFSLGIFLVACSFVFFDHFQGISTYIVIGILVIGVILTVLAEWMFLRKYDGPVSLRTYWTEFLEKLPKDDKLVAFSLSIKYFVKKEFYSFLFLFACVSGIAHWIIPGAATFVAISSFLLLTLNFRFLSIFK